MLVLRLWNNQDVPILGIKISHTQNQISTFDVDVRLEDLSLTLPSLYLTSVEVRYKGSVVISGIIDDYTLDLKEDGSVSVSIKCLDEIGRLGVIKGHSGAYFENQNFLFIIALLLDRGDWELGDITTVLDDTETTTLKIRDKETLWSQLVSVVEAVPNVFFRYGGTNPVSGKHRLDIGFFGEYALTSLVQGQNLKSLQVKVGAKRLLSEIEAYGGMAGDTGIRISLGHALAYDPTLATHPDFPILTDSAGNYVCVNNAVSVGSSITRSYTDVRLDGTPVVADINEAGYALWKKVVKDLKSNSNAVDYSATVVQDPEVYGNTVEDYLSKSVFVHGAARQDALDFNTGLVVPLVIYSVHGTLRVIGYDLQFQEGVITYDMKLSESEYLNPDSDNIQLFDTLQAPQETDTSTPLESTGISTVSVTHGTGVNPDTYFYNESPDFFDGKVFSFPLPAIPPGTTKVAYGIINAGVGITYKITAVPALPATGLELSVVGVNGYWNTSSQATIDVIYIFW